MMENAKIASLNKSVSELLLSGNTVFSIPDFQRDFVWSENEIKDLINDIVNYPYSVVNSKIEQKFLKSNILFCYLTNQYIQTENLNNILNANNIDEVKEELKNISEIINYSVLALENSEGNYSNIDLNEKVSQLNSIISNINDVESLKSNFLMLNQTLNEIHLEINSTLSEYIHI